MQTARDRYAMAAATTFVVFLSIFILTMGPPAQGAHIPATGALPSNCVEFQAGTTGTKSPPGFAGVSITVNSWSDTAGDPHTVSFSISGLADDLYVDISVKSGQTVSEAGPYGNGSHSYSNGLQNAISHIRLCVFRDQSTPTTTVEDTTTTTVEDTTTTTVEDTTTTTAGTTTTDPGENTTTTEPGEGTTTTDPGANTTTTEPSTTTTDEVLGTTITAPSTTRGTDPNEVLGTTIVAGELPFTGLDAATLGQLALGLLTLGGLILIARRSIRGRSSDEA